MDLPRHITSTRPMPHGSSKSKECNINRVFDNATIPGYGVTLKREPCPAEHQLYRGSFAHWHGRPLTLREIAMMAVMNQLMEKPDWHKKIFDKFIVDKWSAEALCLADFSETMWQYCVAELRYKAVHFEETGIVVPIDLDSQVLYSDGAIGRQTLEALVKSVAPLENVPDSEKDWHPGSNGQVLNLVHPSLFPLVFGRSKVLKQNFLNLESCISHCGQGQPIQAPPEVTKKLYGGEYVDDLWSRNYQWLPCEVDISDKNNAKIVSYINNLHPDVHKSLYCAIEDVITKSLPLWARTLETFGFEPPKRRIEFHDISWAEPRGEACSEDSQGADELDENTAPATRSQSPASADSTDDYFWREEIKTLVKPEPQDFSPHDREFRNCFTGTRRHDHYSYVLPATPLNLLDDYRQLQVIVKLANIQLTPDKPDYPGGSWHVEGQLNEHIVVSSLLYYDQHNISPSYLAFRQNVDTRNETQDFPSYGQEEYAQFEDLMGIMNEEDASQELGQVLTKKGRLVVFPNVLHHRVPPFSLQDPSKPGHRKILAIFLVDPHLKILSTAHVPPQQDWWAAELLQKQKDIKGLNKLPAEVMNQIIDEIDGFPMSLEEAKQIRLDLMRERTRNVKEIIDKRAVQHFNFCEH